MAKETESTLQHIVPSWMLLGTIFLTGNIIMMLEVVGTRVVGPYFGVGIYVWSALITVTLLALSAGYWWGGKIADRYKKPEWLYLGILIAGALVLLIPMVRVPLLTLAGELGVRVGVLLGSALLFGPPLFILGTVSPYATKLFTHQFETLGSKVGLLYAVSTLGSFMGTIVMGFFLIPMFSLKTILLGLGFGLILITMIYFFLVRQKKIMTLSIFIIIIGFSVLAFPSGPATKVFANGAKLLYSTNSFYGDIKILQIGNHRMLLVNGVTQSGADMSTMEATPQYVKDLGILTKRFHQHAKEALLVGLGGGNMVHILKQQGLNLDVVEIDEKIKEVAISYFNVDPKAINIVLDDGRHFIKQSKKKYDIIVLNTFSGESFPSHLLTKEFFKEVKSILNPKGIMLLNFVGYVQGDKRAASSAAVRATIHAVFPWGHSYFREPKHRFANTLYVAGYDEEPEALEQMDEWLTLQKFEVIIPNWENAIVCSDDYNPIEFLNREVNKAWRDLVMQSLGPEILLQ